MPFSVQSAHAIVWAHSQAPFSVQNAHPTGSQCANDIERRSMADVGRGSRGLRTALWVSGFEDGVENGGAGVCDDDIWGRCRERRALGQEMGS